MSQSLHFLATVLLALVTCVDSFDVPPTFTLDLSQPPQHRWDGAVAAVLKQHPYEYSFAPVFADHNSSLFKNLTPETFSAIAAAVKRHWPETAAELTGIASQFAALGHVEVSFEYLTAWLYFHELAHSDAGSPSRECTGILAQALDGSVLHGANMDMYPMAARNLTLHVRAVDGDGVLVFEGVDWYALLSTGVSRAMRPGLASVQENWRTTKTRRLEEVLADIKVGVISQMLVFRRFFVAAHVAKSHGKHFTFADLEANMTTTRLAAPFYIVAAGPKRGDGVVIARNLTGADGKAYLAKEKDFLCQCNTDRWLPDDKDDPRRTAAETLLHRLGAKEGTSQLGLYAVLSTYPVLNPNTAFTALMSPASGEFHVYVREATCPVDEAASVVKETPSYPQCSRPGQQIFM